MVNDRMENDMTQANLTVTDLNDSRLTELKHRIKVENMEIRLRRTKLGRTGWYKLKRLDIYPRLGKNNPNRHLYAVGGTLHRKNHQRIRPEHATRFDVYVSDVARGHAPW